MRKLKHEVTFQSNVVRFDWDLNPDSLSLHRITTTALKYRHFIRLILFIHCISNRRHNKIYLVYI